MSLKDKIFQLAQFNSVLLKPLAGWEATGPMKNLKLSNDDLKMTGSILNSMGAARMKDIQKSDISSKIMDPRIVGVTI